MGCLLFILACSEPEIVIPPFEIPTTGQNVLVEELTGVRCPNCPSAAARLESVKLLYGDNIILVNIHGNLLTRPLPESKFDFRNPDAQALEEKLKPFIGKPSVIINRKIHPEFELLANPLQDQWQPIIESELQLEETLTLISSVDQNGNQVELNIAIVPLISLIGTHHLHVFLLENNIIDAQEDVDRIIPDYVHDHVLRRIETPLEGMEIGDLSVPNDVLNVSVMIENFHEEWVTSNMEIVFFVTGPDDEVIQADKISLQ